VHGAPVKTTSLMTTSGCSVQLPLLKYLADATNAISLLNPGTHALSELNSTELEFPWSTNSNAQTRLHMNSRVLCSRPLNTRHQGLTTESLAPKSRNQDQDPGNMDSRPRPRPCRQGLKTKNLAIYTRGRDRELAVRVTKPRSRPCQYIYSRPRPRPRPRHQDFKAKTETLAI